jgi:hypothetical protein
MAVVHKLNLIWVEAAHLENDFDNKTEGMGGEKEYEEAWDKMKSAHGVVGLAPSEFVRGFLSLWYIRVADMKCPGETAVWLFLQSVINL